MKISVALLVLSLALPVAAQSLIDQGKAAMNRGDAEAAAEILEKAVAQTPNSSEAHLLLGDAYGTMAQKASIFSKPGLAKKAQAELEKAVQLDPNNLEARMGLVQFYSFAPGIMGGSDAKAAEQATEMKRRDPVWGHRAWAFIYNYQKKPDLAKKEYTDFVKEEPSSPKSHYWLGVYYMGQKNYKDALAAYESAIKVDPNYLPAVFQLGHIAALSESDYARGEQSLVKYITTYTPKGDEPSKARAYYWLGQIYEKQGKKAEAKQNYAASLKLSPTQKDVQEALKRVS
jgi:tetratricopeptide (TPR) repeat protein